MRTLEPVAAGTGRYAIAAPLAPWHDGSAAQHVNDAPPPYFGASFGLMLAGAILLLIGGALVRNAMLEHKRFYWLDGLLVSRDLLDVSVGLAILVFYYPPLAWRRGMSMWPHLVFVVGLVTCFGPLFYWGWWYGQLP